jgi:hypothetical protein
LRSNKRCHARPCRGTDGRCEKEIASTIIELGADFVLAAKDNQKHLYDEIMESFEHAWEIDRATSLEKGHSILLLNSEEILPANRLMGFAAAIGIYNYHRHLLPAACAKAAHKCFLFVVQVSANR